MKRVAVLTIIGIMAVTGVFSTVGAQSYQGYQVCVPCHNGRTAPDLRGLFSTTEELIRTAKSVKDPMMRNIQQNDELLKAAAKDLGLK
ncbi:MAG: hypothetical protein ACLPN1_10775 [Dissulfurispiraceae bacterium]